MRGSFSLFAVAFLVGLGATSARGDVLLEVADGPSFSLSAQQSVTFALTDATDVTMSFPNAVHPLINDTFACADYASPEAECDGHINVAFTLRSADSTLLLARNLSETVRNNQMVGVITDGEDSGCLFATQGFCGISVTPGTYTFAASLQGNISGKNGGDPAAIGWAQAAQLTFSNGDPVIIGDIVTTPEPRTGLLLLALAAALGSRRLFRRDVRVP